MNDERIGMVLGAGGERVIAWETGVLAGLLDAGFDPRGAAVISGTSAGALVAARLALGVDPRTEGERLAGRNGAPSAPIEDADARVAEAMRLWASSRDRPLAERRRGLGGLALAASAGDQDGFVAGTARLLPDRDWPAALRLATVDAHSGARVRLDAERGVGLARAVAAACALPGLRPAVDIDGYALIDAALGTATNADLLASDVDKVVIATAAAEHPQPGTLDAEFAVGLAAERDALARAGVTVHVVHANQADREAMGDEMFSRARAAEAFAAGRRRGREAAAELTARHATGAFDSGGRSRFNAWFFSAFDRYINHVGRAHKQAAFGGLASGTVLEIGAGVGANLSYLAPGTTLIAVEPNLRMHDRLRERSEKAGVELILVAGGAESIPLPDGSVDEVICSLVLCTVKDPAAVLSEVRRVLREGGRFRFVEHVAAQRGRLRRLVQRALRRPWGWLYEGCDPGPHTVPVLEAAGFRELRVEHRKLRRSLFWPVNTAVWGVATR
jgi:predicted acylesterase/phospholipase RssA/SAM-dependent methyltransferase